MDVLYYFSLLLSITLSITLYYFPLLLFITVLYYPFLLPFTTVLKQWRKPKTRFKNLVRLGVDKVNAAKIAVSGKGYYRLSKTHAL